jgi:hypothetical protein
VCIISVLYFELFIFVPSLFEVFVREEAMVDVNSMVFGDPFSALVGLAGIVICNM